MSEFKKLANHLLDLGKRNRLLNFKDSGMRSINILNKNIGEIYRNIIDSKEYNILLIDSILERQKKDLVLEGEQYDILSYPPTRVYDIITPILKPRQLLCYKKGSQQIKVLKALYREYKFSLNEKGINSLYMAFGFINYPEDKVMFKAPLLLIPLKYTKEVSAYTVKEAEDEVILNPTLEYYFNQQYNIKIPNIENQDQELSDYIETVKAVLPEGMYITEEAAIGIFSFQKMNMYNDLVNNEDQVLKNKNIQALMGNFVEGFTAYPDAKSYPVVNCDSSQLAAINLAVSGQSFVLQGPPGSGKSQTITNIIASLIANNRKVLFVSEKLAALQVVFDNLKKAGLDDFGIELHSSKANKKEFIDNLYKTAMLPKYNVESTLEEDVSTYNAVKQYLDEYVRILHSEIPGEKVTIFDLISEYSIIDLEPMRYRITNLSSYKLLDLKNIENLLLDYSTSIHKLGYDYRTLPFNGLLDTSMEYITYEIEDDLAQSIKYLNKLIELKGKIKDNLKIKDKEIISLNDLYNSFDFIAAANQLSYKENVYLNPEDRAILINAINEYNSLKDSLPVIDMYDKEILKTDINANYWYMKSCTSFFTRLFDKKYKEIKRTVLAYRSGKVKHDVIIEELYKLTVYKNNTESMAEKMEVIKSYFSSAINFDNIDKDLELTKDYIGYSINYGNINKLVDCLLAYKNYQEEDVIYNKLAGKFDLSVIDFHKNDLEYILGKLKEIYEEKVKLKDYSLVKTIVNEITEANQLDFLHTFLSLGLDINTLSQQFKKVYLKNKILEQFDKYPMLNRFNSEQFDNKIKSFIKLDEKMLTINRDIIISKNSQKRPDDVLSADSPFGILTHEYNKVKRKKPIRKLLDEIFRFVLDIKPVFLMSPLSVSTYLSSEPDIFDCVIFDEASQIFAWDALGSIYRAKQCIIIGDSKQMPPTSFFNASVEAEEDIEDDMELESILDMASNCFTTSSLRWHYRSRSEELITFSNKNFYDNTLITIPQAKSHSVGFGIDFIYLPDGRYDAKTRTNIIEARKICDMVIDHYKTSSSSLGVVAFSKVQAELIEDMIDRRVADYPELLKYFSDEVEEPFFVKNLETVQGDERDRIIFSICYGYNMDGKFYQRFGPLNNVGGERRLNVAITRAKYNISVVSSIRYVDIKPTESLGSRLLRDYLEFSENVETEKRYTEANNGIILSVKEFLEESGYEVLTNYGTSKFKIPLAVKKPGKKDFLAAIMIDNKDALTKNTTDYNRLEQLLIKRLGWKYYKLYAPAWFNYQDDSKKELLRFLENCEDVVAPETVVPQDTSYLSEDTKKSEVSTLFMDYYAVPIEELMADFENESAEYVIKKIISTEQPIASSYLLKKMATLLGKKSVTNVVRNFTIANMPDDIIEKNGVYWIKYEENVPLRINSDRVIDDIPVEELKDGIVKVLQYAVSLPKRNCYKKLIEILGCERLSEASKKKLDDAVVFLQLEGRVTVKDDLLSI